jgi:hypothetical protein
MQPTPEITAAMADLAAEVSEQSINRLFRACLTAAGVEWETLASFDPVERLWNREDVIDAIEALQDAHEHDLDTEAERELLLVRIGAAIREPA